MNVVTVTNAGYRVVFPGKSGGPYVAEPHDVMVGLQKRLRLGQRSPRRGRQRVGARVCRRGRDTISVRKESVTRMGYYKND